MKTTKSDCGKTRLTFLLLTASKWLIVLLMRVYFDAIIVVIVITVSMLLHLILILSFFALHHSRKIFLAMVNRCLFLCG